MLFEFSKTLDDTTVSFMEKKGNWEDDVDWYVAELVFDYEWRIEKMRWGIFMSPSIRKIIISLFDRKSGNGRKIDITNWDEEHVYLERGEPWLSLEHEPMHLECDEKTKSVIIEWRT
jgi:hypothetical protein